MNSFIQSSIYQHNWIVPRSVMCTLFWTGVILVFTGMILLVTSKHKGLMYESWGGVLLGLGLCILLICLILCIHAYCVMAADAAARASDEMEDINDDRSAAAAAADAKTKRPAAAGVVDDFHQTLTSTTSDVYSAQANGRKPRSTAPLIPPPKFGVSVTKPSTHTVRFFLSDANNSTPEGEEAGVEKEESAVEEEEAVVRLQGARASKREERGKEDRQIGASSDDTTPSGGRDSSSAAFVVGCAVGNIRTLTGRRPSSPPVKNERRDLSRSTPVPQPQTTASSPPPSASSPTGSVVQQRPQRSMSSSGGAQAIQSSLLLSSDCDSLMSVETIVPRTLPPHPPGNTTPYDDPPSTGRMTGTPYSFLDDDDHRSPSPRPPPDAVDVVEEMEEEERRRRSRRHVTVDPSLGEGGRLSSSSGSAKRKKVNSPFPGPFPASSVSRDAAGKTAGHLSWQTHRHSYAKSKQYSSETSPGSPGSPEPQEDIAPTVASTPSVKLGAKGPGRSAMAPGAWSITRSFGPSSVTVTPLVTHESLATNIHNELYAKGAGDGTTTQLPYHHQHQHQHQLHHGQHRHQGGEHTLNKEPSAGRREHGATGDHYRSMKKEDPGGVWRSMERQRQQQQQQQPVAADRYNIPSPPSPSSSYSNPAPAALEITESKATVYDNVQYFQM